MKTDRKTFFFKITLYLAISTGLVLSGIMAFILFKCPAGELHSQTLFILSLATTGVLLISLAGLPCVLRKFRNQSLNDLHVDSLTGCINRQAFAELFQRTLLASRQSLEPLSLLVIDIDRFRVINEKYGHQAGDRILTLLSKAILSVLQASDITCRWDGNQFLVILQDCPVHGGCLIADKILQKIKKLQLIINENPVKVTTSIGVAQRVASDDVQTLIARAETGLYSARDNGRNTFAIGYDWILIDYYCKPIF